MLLAGFLAGCAYAAPTEPDLELADRIPPPDGPAVRWTARVDIVSPLVTGVFTGVIVARTRPDVRVRMQFFPDIGGKTIDLSTSSARVTGHFPQLGAGTDTTLPYDGRRDPFVMIGVSLIEMFTPVTRDRVLASRDGPGGRWLDLKPVVEGTRIQVLVDENTGVRRRILRMPRGAWWEETLGPGHDFSLDLAGMRLQVTEVAATPLESVPDRTFRLELPEGTRPLRDEERR